MSASVFSAVDDARLVELIGSTRHQLAYVAPGASDAVGAALVSALARLPRERVAITLDPDPEICRLGYGTVTGLGALRKSAKDMGVLIGAQPGLRLGVIVADTRVVLYTPTPLLLEAPPRGADTPNAIELSLGPVEPSGPHPAGPIPPGETGDAPATGGDGVADPQEAALGLTGLDRLLSGVGLGPSGDSGRELGLDPVTRETVDAAEADLAKTPPVAFDLARQLRVYNAHVQFVELSLVGCNISKKRFGIPSHLTPLTSHSDLEARLHAQVELAFRATDALEVGGDTLSEDVLSQRKRKIIEDFLVQLPGYGWIVRKDLKASLQERVEELRRSVTAYGEAVQGVLRKHLDCLRDELVDALAPAALEDLPPRYRKALGEHPRPEQIAEAVAADLRSRLPSAEELARAMEVKLIFKDLTFESLNDERFLAVARKAMPSLEALHSETLAASAVAQPRE